MEWTIAKLREACGGHLHSLKEGIEHQVVRAVSTDTRHIRDGDCFVALSGDRFDGHDFVPGAVQKGAVAVIVQKGASSLNRGIRELLDESCGSSMHPFGVIEVPDTLYALGELARYWRKHHPIPIIGITGSNGKTSTKEMVAAILSRKKQVLRNKGNFNNLIGVPLTLLSLEPHHQVAVIEMGINIPGEMERLVEISGPCVGLITNIHPAHLEGLQSVDGILEQKGKLWAGLEDWKNSDEEHVTEALAVVNMDDERLLRFSGNLNVRKMTYSLGNPDAQVHLAGEVEFRDGASFFQLVLEEKALPIQIPVLGIHQVHNAVAAAAVAYGMGETPESIATGLNAYQPVRQRMQLHRLEDGTVLVDDTYNANPMSMLAAVRALPSIQSSSLSHRGRLVAVLGEMRELGSQSAVLHREVGQRIGSLGLDELITLGDMAQEIANGAQETGMDAAACFHAGSHEEIVSHLRNHRVPGARILVKGSRGMTMERVVEGILAK